jgi:hypothetical protein
MNPGSEHVCSSLLPEREKTSLNEAGTAMKAWRVAVGLRRASFEFGLEKESSGGMAQEACNIVSSPSQEPG